MSWKETAQQWINHIEDNDPLKQQLLDIQEDETELEDCFYTNLAFGTGGMRGLLGPGTNRMNKYTVRKAAAGLAKYIVSEGAEAMKRGIAVAYDSRHYSKEFALEVAKTAGAFDVHTYVFEDIRPTPVLSFAVRHLQAYAGVVITASHNPPEYNGFKVYGNDGAQMLPEAAEQVIHYAETIGPEIHIQVEEEQQLLEKGLLTYIGEEVDEAYIKCVQALQTNTQEVNEQLSIVFTPLHGTASALVRKGLNVFGFKDVQVVQEQNIPDPNFSTVESPNPEEHEAFTLAIEYGEKVDADILMATDPDADRLGVAEKNEHGIYEVLTGNQTGALMIDYLLQTYKEQGKLPENGLILKTIVTSELGAVIAKDFEVDSLDTLTGFKYIAEQIARFEETNDYTFLFGYEESYGYLIGDFVRDKDAVQLTVCIAEMAAYYKEKGLTLYGALQSLFERYGYYKESLQSITLKGKDGVGKMQALLDAFRNDPIKEIADCKVETIEDYESREKLYCLTDTIKEITLPQSNVLKYTLEDGSWFCIRPSGTEPKCKFYIGVQGDTEQESTDKLATLEQAVMKLVQKKQ